MKIRKFLCCMSLRDGSFLCAFGSLLISCLRLYFQWFNIEFLHRLSETQRSDLPLSMKTLRGLGYLSSSVTAVSMVTAVLLLIGLCKYRHNFLTPWMVWVILEELVDIGLLISYAASHVKLCYSVYIGDAVFFVINLYCILCVFSYMKQLKKEASERELPVYSLGADMDSDEECLIAQTPGII